MNRSSISLATPGGVEVRAAVSAAQDEILTPEAMAFLATLHRRFGHQREELLRRRHERQAALDRGERPDFLPETRHIREGDWTVAPTPANLQDRRVEITGPTDRKMVINARNSGARVFMTDFEDANSPTWANMLDGQITGKGAKAPTPGLVMQLLPRRDDAPFRVGFTVTKKVGNAVVRNRTKRRLREAVRLALDAEAWRGFDMVVIGRDRTADRPFTDLMADVRRAAAKARQVAASADAGKGGVTP